MEKVILSLLSNQNTVIIPKFGAFIKDNKRNNVYFNEHLKFDDRVVVLYITKSSDLSEEEAYSYIQEWVKKVSGNLEKGIPFQLPELGKLQRTGLGTELLYLEDSEKKLVVSPTPVSNETTQNLIQETEEKPLEEIGIEEEIISVSIEDKIIIEEPEIEIPVEKVEFEIPEQQEKETEKSKIEEITEEVVNTHKKRKSILWLLLFVLIGGGLFFMFHTNENQETSVVSTNNHPKKATSNSIEEEQQKEIASSAQAELNQLPEESEKPALINEESPVEKQIETSISEEQIEEKEESVVTSEPSNTKNKQFRIIGNSFKEEANANIFAEELKSKGYTNARVTGNVSGYFMVEYDAFDDRQSAKDKLEEIKEIAPNAWILFI